MEMAMARGNIRNDIVDTYLSLKFELLRYLKTKRLLILGALAIIVPQLFLVEVPNVAGAYAAFALDAFGVFIVISAAMFTGDAVSGEFERKTYLLSFSTPQRHASIFLGKYIAAVLATFFVITLYYLTMTLQIAGLYGWGEIPVQLAESWGISLLCAMSAVGVVLVFSGIMRRSMAATIVGALFIMWVMEALKLIMMLLDSEPWFVPTYAADLLKNVIPALSGQSIAPQVEFARHIQEQFGVSLTFFQPRLAVGIAVLAVWAIVGFVLGMGIASRRED